VSRYLPVFAPGTGGWLAWLCTARLLAATWVVAYSAVLPVTQAEWGLSAREAGLIQGAFYVGYLVSFFAVGMLTDHYGARFAYLSGGIAAWATPFAFVCFAQGFWSAFWLLALTGLCQGSTYSPAMALVNDNVPRERRGRAMGYLIAAACAGYALCLAVAGLVLTFWGWRAALGAVAAMPLAAWFIGMLALRATPNVVHPRPTDERFLGSLRAVFANRRGMLSIWGYSFHTWEQFGVWAWLPAFLAAGLIASGSDVATGAALGAVLSAITHLANVAGSITGGTMADRWGRTHTVLLWSCVSALACFAIGWLGMLPLAALVLFACVLNFSAVADSSTHSTVLAESVPPHQLGMAYAVRGVIAVGAGAVSPVVFGWVLDLAGGGARPGGSSAWGLAFGALALVATLGPLATWRLHRMPVGVDGAGGAR
jgi:MFS family permease